MGRFFMGGLFFCDDGIKKTPFEKKRMANIKTEELRAKYQP